MNKNQSIIIMIVVVLVVASIFLYFVFRSNMQNNDAKIVQENEGKHSFDVDVIDAIESEMENGSSKQVVVIEDVSIDKKIAVGSGEKKVITEEINNSPETGPGFAAAIIAAVIALVFAFGMYKKSSTHKS